MQVAVVGSRTPRHSPKEIYDVLDSYDVSLLVSGGAKGVDSIAYDYAKARGIPRLVVKPDYERFPGWAAPIIRNQVIVDYADLVIVFWDGKSKGAHNVIKRAFNDNKACVVYEK